jgi:hypothetical protein
MEPPGLRRPNFTPPAHNQYTPATIRSQSPETPPQAARQGEFVYPRGETGNRGGRGFEQRVLKSVHNFDFHISLDPPRRPMSP